MADNDAELLEALGEDPPDGEPGEFELDSLDPIPETVTLSSGLEVHLLRIGTRQMFRLLRIITHGAGPNLMNIQIDFRDNPEVFASKFIALVLFSLPDADQEALDFIQSVCEPVGLVDKRPRDLNEKDREHNIALWTEVNEALWNPPPMDTLDIIEAVLRREAPEFQALGKRLRGFLVMAQKLGQLKPGGSPSSQDGPERSDRSREPSTSSPVSTAGRTNGSSASRSAGSGRSPRPSGGASGRRSGSAAR